MHALKLQNDSKKLPSLEEQKQSLEATGIKKMQLLFQLLINLITDMIRVDVHIHSLNPSKTILVESSTFLSPRGRIMPACMRLYQTKSLLERNRSRSRHTSTLQGLPPFFLFAFKYKPNHKTFLALNPQRIYSITKYMKIAKACPDIHTYVEKVVIIT